MDSGEECDNGNQVGCSFDCRVDTGFKCTSVSGFPSVCGFCGNSIVEKGEECDNSNGFGCSKDCEVDAGFFCRGISPSICYRSNPVCGNSIIEIGEVCDDGNKVAGDGCGLTCLIEDGFNCTGEPSKCSKKSENSPNCGNSVFEPENNEQCDNGNNQGCLDCAIQKDWECFNKRGLPSTCWPEVVIPHCGNGVYEPALNEICDDGNVANGDGCNYFCQVEFGWVCYDNKNCVNIAHQNLFCGNGNVEQFYGETCDDGNVIDGDGCSSFCKVEDGWKCQANPMMNKSYCSREFSYCGNGVVDGRETCDDGFPLRNWDGCDVNCRIEPGWNCATSLISLISRCWPL